MEMTVAIAAVMTPTLAIWKMAKKETRARGGRMPHNKGIREFLLELFIIVLPSLVWRALLPPFTVALQNIHNLWLAEEISNIFELIPTYISIFVIVSAKAKNREHAKNTRIRKKHYIEALKESLKLLSEERDKIDRDRRNSLSRLAEQVIGT